MSRDLRLSLTVFAIFAVAFLAQLAAQAVAR